MTIEEYVASKEPYRVSSNGIPLTVPFSNPRPNADYFHAMTHYEAHDLDSRVIEILAEHDIKWRSLNIRHRVKPYSGNEKGINTLIIETSNENPETWKEVAIRLKSFMEAESLFEDIDVEISNRDYSRSMTSSILSADPETLRTLEKLKPEILEVLRSLRPSGLQWTSLAFHNRSPRGESSEDAKKPTAIIFVMPAIRFDFHGLEARLLEILQASEIPVNIEILPGRVVSGSYPARQSWVVRSPAEPDNGASVGVSGDKERAGSLGFWTLAHLPGVEEPEKVACTAFDAVVDNDPHGRKNTEAIGVRLKQMSGQGKVEVQYPAYCDCVKRVEGLEKAMQYDPSPPVAAELEIARGHLNQPKLGSVTMASGLRTNSAGRRMNWALFTCPDAFKQNHVPRSDQFAAPHNRPYEYPSITDFVMSKTGKLRAGDWVTRNGRSGVNTGYVNRMHRHVLWEDHPHMITEEVEVIGAEGIYGGFAYPGDNGAAVINEKGELVGMLIGMEPNSTFENSGFVTPIEDIFEDVKERENVTLVLP